MIKLLIRFARELELLYHSPEEPPAWSDMSVSLPSLDAILDRTPLTVMQQTSISDAIQTMLQAHTPQFSSYVLVLDGGCPIGIFTERDVLRLSVTGIEFSQVAIAEVMMHPLITLPLSINSSSEYCIEAASTIFQQHLIQHLPVVNDQGQLLGVITRETVKQQQLSTTLNANQQQMSQQWNAAYTAQVQQSAIALQHSEAKFRHFAENSHAVIWIAQITSLDNLYVSPAYEKIWGRSRQSLIDRPDSWIEAIHPDDQERVRIKLEQQRQGAFSDVEYRIIRPDGSIRWIWDWGFPIRNGMGQIDSFGGIAEDITERKQLELQQREMSEALSNAVEGISRLDPQGCYMAVNEAYASMVGYTPEDMVGMNWQKTVHPDDLATVIAEYEEMLRTGKVELETRGIRKDGSVFNKQLCMISAYDEQHRFSGHHCFMKDISERKRWEADKKELEAQILRAQRLESIGTLASGIAHDLNNILTPILAAAQLLPHKLSPVDGSTQRLLEILEINAKRGRDLVKQVLAFGRGNGSQRTNLQVGHLLEEVSQIVQQTFPKSIQIQIQIEAGLWLLQADATQIHQMIMNLCVNARDAMPHGGRLTIAAENCELDEIFVRTHLDAHVGRYLKITVADTGTGIAPDVLDRIFDPFFTTKDQGKGTGLGLSTVLTIVKHHGGLIDIHTQAEQGTSFQVYLPALEQGEELTIAPPLLRDNRSGECHNELILVVDDEAAIGQTIQATLEVHHYRVLVAQDGVAAISLYAQHRSEIALVLLDLMMPDFDGFKLISTLSKFNPQIQLIAMSGLTSHQANAMSNDRVQAFLAKPFTTEDLLAVIAQVLAQSHP